MGGLLDKANAAKEPEIVDLVKCLRSMGAQIKGEGSSNIEIQGVDRLGGTTHPVVVDRIELGTYMIAPAIAGGQVDLIGGKKDLLGKFWQSLELSGLEISETAEGIRAKKVSDIIKAVDVKTEVYPGFATDLFGFLLIFPLTRKLIFGKIINKFKNETKIKKPYIEGEFEDIEEDDERKL